LFLWIRRIGMKKKRILLIDDSRPSKKQPITLEDLRRVMGAEVANQGSGTVNDPPASDTKPPLH
jgi:hypothetical protein